MNDQANKKNKMLVNCWGLNFLDGCSACYIVIHQIKNKHACIAMYLIDLSVIAITKMICNAINKTIYDIKCITK